MPLPASVEYGSVKWQALSAAADGADGDSLPDAVPVTGQVIFQPKVTGPLLSISTTPPVTIFPVPVSYTLDADGVLRDSQGSDTIYLVATDSAGLTPVDWTWQAVYNLNDGLVMGSFDFELPAGTTVDLTTVTPVSSSSGTPIIQGPPGTDGRGFTPRGTYTVGVSYNTDDLVTGGGSVSRVTAPFVAGSGSDTPDKYELWAAKGDTGATGPTPDISGTSTTSTTIGTGSKTFTTQTGIEGFTVGQFVRLASAANGTNYMAGNVTAYSGTTLTVNVTETGGSGTLADWNISISGVKGATGNTGSTGPAPVISGTSATSFTPSVGSKVFTTQSGVQGFTVGQFLRIASAAAPSDYMGGTVTAYSGTSLTVNVTEFSGSTARTDWQISLSGPAGPTGAPGAGVPSGGLTGQVISHNGVTAVWVDSATAGSANTFAKRDANGRLQVANGVAASDVATVGQTIPAFADPNADRIVFWDDSAGAFVALSVTTPLTITGTAMSVNAADTTNAGIVELATNAETTTGTDTVRAVTPAGVKAVADLKADKSITTTTQAGTTYTLALADAGTDIEFTNTAAIAVTIPTNASVAFPVGTVITLWAIGTGASAGQITVSGAGVTLQSRGNALKTNGQFAPITLKKRATDTWIISGDITT